MPVVTQDKRISIPPPRRPDDGRGGGGGPEDSGSSFPVSKEQIGLWVLLTAIIMLFAGLTSAYIVLRGVPTWQNIELPWLLWPNTFVLLLSSFTLELAKGAIRRNRIATMNRWLGLSALLGVVFIAGQLAAWRQLVHAGVYLPSTLQSGFFCGTYPPVSVSSPKTREPLRMLYAFSRALMSLAISKTSCDGSTINRLFARLVFILSG